MFSHLSPPEPESGSRASHDKGVIFIRSRKEMHGKKRFPAHLGKVRVLLKSPVNDGVYMSQEGK
jgi:hypothetical protein